MSTFCCSAKHEHIVLLSKARALCPAQQQHKEPTTSTLCFSAKHEHIALLAKHEHIALLSNRTMSRPRAHCASMCRLLTRFNPPANIDLRDEQREQ